MYSKLYDDVVCKMKNEKMKNLSDKEIKRVFGDCVSSDRLIKYVKKNKKYFQDFILKKVIKKEELKLKDFIKGTSAKPCTRYKYHLELKNIDHLVSNLTGGIFIEIFFHISLETWICEIQTYLPYGERKQFTSKSKSLKDIKSCISFANKNFQIHKHFVMDEIKSYVKKLKKIYKKIQNNKI